MRFKNLTIKYTDRLEYQLQHFQHLTFNQTRSPVYSVTGPQTCMLTICKIVIVLRLGRALVEYIQKRFGNYSPITFSYRTKALVAQLDRASDF